MQDPDVSSGVVDSTEPRPLSKERESPPKRRVKEDGSGNLNHVSAYVSVARGAPTWMHSIRRGTKLEVIMIYHNHDKKRNNGRDDHQAPEKSYDRKKAP